MPFVPTAHPLAPVKVANLMSVDNVRKKFPIVPISAADVTPQYVPVFTWNGGVRGDEKIAETNVLVDDRGVGDYGPRNRAEFKEWPGVPNSIVPSESALSGRAVTSITDYVDSVDVGVPRGSITPQTPYPTAGSPAPAAPTLASIAPATAIVGSPPIWCKLTGTGFTQWSTVKTGGVYTSYTKWVSSTVMWVMIDPLRSVPGTIDVIVTDHSVDTSPQTFTFTASE